jgi:hypothetical protein
VQLELGVRVGVQVRARIVHGADGAYPEGSPAQPGVQC